MLVAWPTPWYLGAELQRPTPKMLTVPDLQLLFNPKANFGQTAAVEQWPIASRATRLDRAFCWQRHLCGFEDAGARVRKQVCSQWEPMERSVQPIYFHIFEGTGKSLRRACRGSRPGIELIRIAGLIGPVSASDPECLYATVTKQNAGRKK